MESCKEKHDELNNVKKLFVLAIMNYIFGRNLTFNKIYNKNNLYNGNKFQITK